MFDIKSGEENGVKWSVDESGIDTVVITVEKISTGEIESFSYKCQHMPIFGYDVLDCQLIEEKLDELIKKYSEVKC